MIVRTLARASGVMRARRSYSSSVREQVLAEPQRKGKEGRKEGRKGGGGGGGGLFQGQITFSAAAFSARFLATSSSRSSFFCFELSSASDACDVRRHEE